MVCKIELIFETSIDIADIINNLKVPHSRLISIQCVEPSDEYAPQPLPSPFFAKFNPTWKSKRELTHAGRVALCRALIAKVDRHYLAEFFGLKISSIRLYEERIAGTKPWPYGKNLDNRLGLKRV